MATVESQLASLLAAAERLSEQLRLVQTEINRLSLNPTAPGAAARLSELEAQRQEIRIALANINNQIAQSQADVNGRISSGQVVAGEQIAKAENSLEVSPQDSPFQIFQNGRIKLPPDTSSGSNADTLSPSNELTLDLRNFNSGLDAELRPLILTQSTPFASQGLGSGIGLKYRVPGTATVNEDLVSSGKFVGDYSLSPEPGGAPGVGAASDDSGTAGGQTSIVTALNAIDYSAKIVPQDNVLDQFASYTYQASLYLCTKQQYQRMINTGQKTISGAQLLMQSAGASISTGIRNPNFDLDYYIDRIELRSFFVGKAVRLAHNVKEVRMTVVEPNGITLLDRLKLAVDQFAPSLSSTVTTNQTNTTAAPGARSKNFTAQIYLLAIRFYGYDDQGNLIRAGSKPGQTTDPSAFVEKWYPLILSKFNFKVASKVTEYDLEFKAPPYYINASAQRGTIPFNIELSGGTVKDILTGPTVYGEGQSAVVAGGNSADAAAQARANFAASDPRRVDLPTTQAAIRAVDNALANGAPPKANAATSAKKTVRQGIMAALNAYQQQLVTEGVYQYPDEYNIEFVLDAMASATINSPGTNSVSKGNTSMAAATTAADVKLGSKQSMDPNSRVQGAVAGTQIVQFIDTLLRNSSYIKDQQLLVIDENTGKEKATGVQVKNVSWYKIGFRAEAKFDQYDEKRNDYAYKITYVVSPYKIVQLNSPYFPEPQFNGVHKSYKYWFTGENTQVLSYEENLNSLYYVVMSGSNLGGVSSRTDAEQKFSYQTASGQASQGADGKTLEPASNASDQLYNPADLKSCKVTIVGDPAWLQQGEAFVGLKKGQPDYFKAFLDDGTINFDSQQILFEIAYNTAADYDLQTGLMTPNRGKSNTSTPNLQGTTDSSSLPTQASRVYIAKQCVSEFKQGKFTQTLEGTLKLFSPKKQTSQRTTEAVATGSAGSQSAADEVYGGTAADQGARTQISAPVYVPPTSVTGQTPTSATARGVQQLLRPPTQLAEPTLAQLQASPAYIQARRGGATPQAALDRARAAFAAGTNNFAGVALPGIRDTAGVFQKVVKDGNPG